MRKGSLSATAVLFASAWLGAGCTPKPAAAPDSPPDVEVEIDVDEPTAGSPVSVGAAVAPKKVAPGEKIVFVVRARTAPGWHIYAVDRPGGISVPTTLELKLPPDWKTPGDWAGPEAIAYGSGATASHIYKGDVSFRHYVVVPNGAAPGPVELTCTFGYQACDPVQCHLPKRVNVVATAEVVASP